MFKDIDHVIEALKGENYIASKEIATTIYLAMILEKPVLVEGPAGVGKTELAKCISSALELDLVRLQCYEGLDESKALYEWEYAKQLLYTQLLKDKLSEVLKEENSVEDAMTKLNNIENMFFSDKFLVPRPLMKAITNEKKTVLLIDEIDKADSEFEAFLLELLSDFQISIPEIGTIKAKNKPVVILTSNSAREMSDALKRRCLHLYVDYPTRDLEEEIISLKVPEAKNSLVSGVVDAIQKTRDLKLKKEPSISETLDWARALVVLGHDVLDHDTAIQTLNIFLKYEKDIEMFKKNSKGIFPE